ncbi:MAG: ATP synthase F1 subunit delta [Planctomycetota bacterium]|jgi:F-type H+-transporting ATPase subunit delta
MNRSEPASVCYAQALIEIAKAKGNLATVLDDLRAVMELFHADKTLWRLYTSPRIDRFKKEEMVKKAFTGRVGDEVLGLLVVMVRKGREYLYDNVVNQFIRFKDVAENRIHVYVRTVNPLTDEVRTSIEKVVTESSGKDVVMHEDQDPSLLGGMVVRVGDIQVDGSVRGHLRKLGRKLVGED